ncbi:MAG: peroxide stress protein YaaA [Flavobacteriales bacterium]|jgi:cytoplasmic iron level regulating protein YaaA (DUF328/UPF0246 family)|nr:peroxide stress protein YaaA [Flavobacteriales bacterium]
MLLSIISPAKNINENWENTGFESTQPQFLAQANDLMKTLKSKSPEELGKLMKLSEKLSDLNYERNQNWKKKHTEEQTIPAAFAFNGDVYKGLETVSLSTEELERLNESTFILSGLYGLLKPLDLIYPYRLEMGTKMENSGGKNLYEFWGNRLGENIQKNLKKHHGTALINLASNEYFKAVDTKEIQVPIWTPIFKDEKNGVYKIISFYAKKARGMMVRYMIQNKVETIEKLCNFDSDGYYFDSIDEQKKQIIFHRN